MMPEAPSPLPADEPSPRRGRVLPASPGQVSQAKRAAARRAADMVEDGMRVGLGTGSTAKFLVERLGERVAEGLRLSAVPTSRDTARLAAEAGIDLITLDALSEGGRLDLCIDGADEIDPNLTLIKGGGGALLREKIVATASERMIVIADVTKAVDRLGAFPLPLEAAAFGVEVTRAAVEGAMIGLGLPGHEARLRMAGEQPFETDGGGRILDLHLGRIDDPWQTSLVVNQIPGVVENGLFVDIAELAVIGWPDGATEIKHAGEGGWDRGDHPLDADNAFAAALAEEG